MKTTPEERDTWADILDMADDTEKKILITFACKILDDFRDLESALAAETKRREEAEAARDRLKARAERAIGLFHMALREAGCSDEQINNYDIQYHLLADDGEALPKAQP